MIHENMARENFFWLNEPEHSYLNDTLTMITKPDTDFWQNTHYGFQRDSGHCLLVEAENNFSISVRTCFEPKKQYDQCGLMVRVDKDNWIKCSLEFETEIHSRLGSVVTNMGYSDWATVDLDSGPKEMWYRIQSKGNDFLIEFSFDGKEWQQMRIAHLHADLSELNIGIYGCSPMDSSFSVKFDHLKIEDSNW